MSEKPIPELKEILKYVRVFTEVDSESVQEVLAQFALE